jgi:hypothetical protein
LRAQISETRIDSRKRGGHILGTGWGGDGTTRAIDQTGDEGQNVFLLSCHLTMIASFLLAFYILRALQQISTAYFATGFRYVGIRKIMAFLGLSQIFLSVFFVGFFIFAIVVFA